MDKIICEVCGTSYSEAANQCPICGYANSGSMDISAGFDNEAGSSQPKYQHVKGGRFSTANVKKRNQQVPVAAPAAKPAKKKHTAETPVAHKEKAAPKKVESKKTESEKRSSNRGLVITVLVLLLAIIAVIGYIAVTFVLPVVMPKKAEPAATHEPTYVTEPTPAPAPVITCVDIEIDPTELIFDFVGETAQITAVPVPADVADGVTYTPGDPAIAIVDENGFVTAVGTGDTEIIITCGDISVRCAVTVNEEIMEFAFDQTDVTLTAVGEECAIYSGVLPAEDITWHSDDEQVATIQNGVVVAVGSGSTLVYGEYDGMTISCMVNCEVAEETEPTVDMSAIEANGPYHLHNPYGMSDTDASIKVGVSFTLYLLDKNDQQVSGVEWAVKDGSSCKVEDGKVTGIAKGNCNVVATYGGKTYTCIVRVS